MGTLSRSRALWERLVEGRLIALLNPGSPDDCVEAYEAMSSLGIVLEVAMRGEAAVPGMRAVLDKHPDALLMAGTVLTVDQARQVLDVGVAGVVSADFLPGVVEACVAEDVMCIPGGIADVGKQLVQKADLYGLTLDELRWEKPWQWVYKVFPAMANPAATLATVRAWRAVYPQLKVVYTGGVNLENVGYLARQDPDGIFCGSALTKQVRDPDAMCEEASRWIGEVTGDKSTSDTKPAADTTGKESTGGARRDPTSWSENGVVTFGELMLRLSPPAGNRFRQATVFDATFGGAEANVAVALAVWGVQSSFVTALPDNDIGQMAVDKLRATGVDTSRVLRQGERVGIYFLEYGASQRPSRVIYDRAGSAISNLKPGDVDWDSVFAETSWFHWTGITPALGEQVASVTAEAVRAAKKAGITVSADLNYRSKLWSRDRAREVMTSLMEFTDIVVANEEDAADVFGISAKDVKPESGELKSNAYESVARQLVERFDLQVAAITLRESHSASDNSWSGCLWNGEDFLMSRRYPIHLVDRVGGGDAFSAGLIYGLLSGKNHQGALEFGVAASCLKQTIVGDFNLATVNEVETLVEGNVSGRIRR